MATTLILASSSSHRRQLLDRLRVPFEVHAADVDEAPLAGESARDLATRLARAKAAAVAGQFPDAWVIGSDQVAVCRNRLIGKPGNATQNIEQLRNTNGQTVSFLTAVCLLRNSDARSEQHLDTTLVHFRTLEAAEIERYVRLEPAFDCAGGFKSEGLGISLFERIESQDPTALIGLPLIWLTQALRRAGIPAP